MKAYGRFLLSAVAFLVCACGSPGMSSNCPDNVSIKVQMGEQPIFSWEPACNPDRFAVSIKTGVYIVGHGDAIAAWEIEEDARPISPPITYGVNPAGVVEIITADPLEEEKGYRAEVLVYSEDSLTRPEWDPQRFDSVGEAEFIYAP